MRHFVIAMILLAVLITAVFASSAAVNGRISEITELINSGDHDGALDLFEESKYSLSASVNACELERLEEALIDLAAGVTEAKEKALSVCKEIANRERLCLTAVL